MSLLLRIDRPLWVTREGPGWVWQCRVCPPPHCWCAQHAKTWAQAMTDSHTHLAEHATTTATTTTATTALGRAA